MSSGGAIIKNESGKDLLFDALQVNTGRIINALFGKAESKKLIKKFKYLDELRNADDGYLNNEPNCFIISGSIQTDGYKLNIYFYDMRMSFANGFLIF